METRAGDPGAFAHFDLSRVDSPAFVVDAAKLRANLAILADVRDRAGVKVLAALKAFSMWRVAPLIGEALDGVCASGLWEARLAREHYLGEVATYCAGYKAEDLPEICAISDHVIFNSPGQIARFRPILDACRGKAAHPDSSPGTGEVGRGSSDATSTRGFAPLPHPQPLPAGEGSRSFDIGLRINPLHATGEVPRYDPCAPHSRLGFPVDQLAPAHLTGVSGLHFHTLCEQDFGPLQSTWAALRPHIAPYLAQLKWLNFGGGHHITRADYQRGELVEFLKAVKAETGCDIYLEPGEAVALDAGILVGTILDTHWNGMPLAITDISATCHMPDVIEAPYRPAMLGEVAPLNPPPLGEVAARSADGGGAASPDGGGFLEPRQSLTRLGGPSCLAGDVIGDYHLPAPVEPGQRFAFLDQAHYSMVKTTTFNGVPLPSIWLWDSADDSLECVRRFGWETFRDRLS